MNKTHSNRRNTIIQYSIIAAAAISIGVAGGIVMKKKFGGEEITYSGFDPELFKEDSAALVREYQKNPNKNFTAAELVCIGLEKYRTCENSYSFTVGEANTIVTQTIRNAQIKNGDQLFEESISCSKMVSLAGRVTQCGDTVKTFDGKATGPESGEYTAQTGSFDAKTYKEEHGKTPEEMFVYIISNQTVLEGKSKIERVGGKIKVSIELDKDIATYYYKIQMKAMSNLSGLPTFDYVKQTYTFDENMTLEHAYIEEKYDAVMSGVSATIVNTLNNYYHAGAYIKIPELNESVIYPN